MVQIELERSIRSKTLKIVIFLQYSGNNEVSTIMEFSSIGYTKMRNAAIIGRDFYSYFCYISTIKFILSQTF